MLRLRLVPTRNVKMITTNTGTSTVTDDLIISDSVEFLLLI